MITLVAAISANNCIGAKGELPWDIPEDMARMREFTRHKVLIMGRKTWESIPEKRRPLPNRTNVIITRDANYQLPAGAERYETIAAAIEAHKGEEIVGFGGQKIFEEIMPIADALEITHVYRTIDACDAFFPAIDLSVWKEVTREEHDGFAFARYERR